MKVGIMKLISFLVASGVVISMFSPLGLRASALTVTPEVVISQVKVGTVSQPRLVELYNNGATAVDVTGWCVRYVSAASVVSEAAGSVRACFVPVETGERLILPTASHLLVASTQTGLPADFILNDTLGSGSGGKVYLTTSEGVVVDLFGWGEVTQFAETSPQPVSSSGVYQRQLSSSGGYVDTQNNAADFNAGQLRQEYQVGMLESVLDLCTNLPDIQLEVPTGYESGEPGICQLQIIDQCLNIEGVQAEVTPPLVPVESMECVADYCRNLEGVQTVPPDGYVAAGEYLCSPPAKPLLITELLPNPEGEDKGQEFIEFFNPNEEEVFLSDYGLYINGDMAKPFVLPGVQILPKSYFVLTSQVVPFVLTNTVGTVLLRSVDTTYNYAVPEYAQAEAGASWNIDEEGWFMSSTITPGESNRRPYVGMGGVGVSSVVAADCGEGRERNPATNRCRNLPVASVRQPCKEGQYRSEETNRCRSLASAVSVTLKPCADDQYRSPLTNRCRKIADADDLAAADCGEGRERNPATGRCRNVLKAATVPAAAYAVEPVTQGAQALLGWWALGGVMTLALGYAGWEWRRELVDMLRRAVQYIRPR